MEPLKNGMIYERAAPILQRMLCLESLGYVQGDINPGNTLLDDKDQHNLVDLDHSLKIGGSRREV